jgi:hypothetical protein
MACVLLATACNEVLGIGVPDLVAPDASTDGGSRDAALPDSDATVADVMPGDSTVTDAFEGGSADGPDAPDASPDSSSADVGMDGTLADSSSADVGVDSTLMLADSSNAGDTADSSPLDSSIPDAADGAVADSASADVFDGNCTCASDACAPVVLATGQTSPKHVAFDSTSVYWLDEGSEVTADGTLMRINRDGTNLTTFAPALYAPSDLAVGGGVAYWSSPSPAAVMAESTSGGSQPQAIATLSANGIAATSTGAAWTTSSLVQPGIDVYTVGADGGALFVQDVGDPVRIAIGGAALFWSSNSGVSTCPLAGCSAPVPFWTDTGTPTVTGLAVDALNVYWTLLNTGGVYACPTSGCTASPVPPIYTPPTSGAGLLASDGTHLYAITGVNNPAASSIVRMGLDGTAPTIVASGQSIGGLAVGDTCVYWTDELAGTLYASPK